jgi:hypothetical protein
MMNSDFGGISVFLVAVDFVVVMEGLIMEPEWRAMGAES